MGRCGSGAKQSQTPAKHPVAHGKKKYLTAASAYLGCQTPPDELSWFYFKSPRETWEMLCGTAGWMVVCDKCHLDIFWLKDEALESAAGGDTHRYLRLYPMGGPIHL